MTRATRNEPDFVLTRAQLEAVVSGLRRCSKSRSGQGKAKASIPLLSLAAHLAARYDQIPYACDNHWHLAKAPARDRCSSGRAAEYINEVIGYAYAIAAASRQRRHVYGTRDANGRWMYRVHLATFRDSIAREGEL